MVIKELINFVSFFLICHVGKNPISNFRRDLSKKFYCMLYVVNCKSLNFFIFLQMYVKNIQGLGGTFPRFLNQMSLVFWSSSGLLFDEDENFNFWRSQTLKDSIIL